MRRGAAGLFLLLMGLTTRAAAPALYSSLTAAQQKQVERWTEQSTRHALAGEFGEAEQLARQVLALRKRVQGPRHWETVDAALPVERWRRLASLPARTRVDLG